MRSERRSGTIELFDLNVTRRKNSDLPYLLASVTMFKSMGAGGTVLESLAREYLDIIDRIRYSDFADQNELRWLEGQRGLLHDQPCDMLGISHDSDITEQARAIVLGAQGEGRWPVDD